MFKDRFVLVNNPELFVHTNDNNNDKTKTNNNDRTKNSRPKYRDIAESYLILILIGSVLFQLSLFSVNEKCWL